MRETFFNDVTDIQWVRMAHLPKGAGSFGSFVLHGNEDCPTMIVCYDAINPNVDDIPVAIYGWNAEGSMSLVAYST